MFSRLTRAHLSFLVAFSALAGYLFHPFAASGSGAVWLVAGVWFLSAGASALNQAQERDIDARMERTRARPLVTGRLSLSAGVAISLMLIATGMICLWATGNARVVLLGLFALAWYNGVYTPLKKLTPFAVLPGALCGAVPPLMGWSLAGGGLLDYPILMLMAIVVLWQVPHFWLLALSYPDDIRRNGLPDLFSRISPSRLRNLSIVWVTALLAGISCASLAGLIQADVSRIVVALAMLLLAGALIRFRTRGPVPAGSLRLFVQLNLFMTLWFAIVAFDRLVLQLHDISLLTGLG